MYALHPAMRTCDEDSALSLNKEVLKHVQADVNVCVRINPYNCA